MTGQTGTRKEFLEILFLGFMFYCWKIYTYITDRMQVIYSEWDLLSLVRESFQYKLNKGEQ